MHNSYATQRNIHRIGSFGILDVIDTIIYRLKCSTTCWSEVELSSYTIGIDAIDSPAIHSVSLIALNVLTSEMITDAILPKLNPVSVQNKYQHTHF